MLDAETSGGKTSSVTLQIIISARLLSSAVFLIFALHSTVPKVQVTGGSAHGPGCVPHTSEQNASLL